VTEATLEDGFVVFAPTGRDADLTCDLLARARLAGRPCRDLDGVLAALDEGAAGLLVAEEALSPATCERLAAWLEHQEPWSDLPVLVFTGEGSRIGRGPPPSTLARLGNVSLLDRPVRPFTMVSAARAALRARRRQYAAREELVRQTNAVRQRDAFLAMLGHELRNPLSAIGLASDLIERSADVSRYSPTLRRQVRHLTRLVDDLLDVARVTTGKIVLQRQRVDLDDAVARAASVVEPRLGARTLRVEASGGACVVDADPVRLDQVLGNLLTNATKYTPEHGRIEVRVSADGPWAIVEVRDDGFGISAAMLGRVFDLFAQADETTDRAQGGLGIGLTLVRTLVQQHGGTVAAASDGPGRGSTFTVRLPRVEVGAASRGADGGATERGPRRRVLVVEDHADARELLRDALAALGHEVETAADGETAVARALQLRPDTLLVDIGLPRLDGYEVARRVRAALEGALLVAVTGYGQPEDRRRAREAGFDAHCTKPVALGRLGALLAAGRAPAEEEIGTA
jgi:signal transduction histidine kinase/CheY-like chemotaxis protein